MTKSNLLSLFSPKTLIYLSFISVVSQFGIVLASFPFYIFGLIAALGNGTLKQYFEITPFLYFLLFISIFIFFSYIFRKFTLDIQLISEKSLIFLLNLIISILVHFHAFLNMNFYYFISFISVIGLLQTITIIHARNNTISKNNFVWISMVLGIIGGLIMALYFYPFIWIGETILKLTNHQFNLFWFDYGGSAFIYLSLATSLMYFVLHYILKLITRK